jgi:galactose-1-phosphate uridylyltransferase
MEKELNLATAEYAKETATKEEKAVTTAADDVKEIVIEDEDETFDAVVELSQKFKFEGKIIDKIDLGGLATLSAKEGQTIEKLYRKITSGVNASPELTMDYAMAAASVLTGLPVEFFKSINIKDIVKIKNRVVNFLYSD